jgi:hypothetical protein
VVVAVEVEPDAGEGQAGYTVRWQPRRGLPPEERLGRLVAATLD